MMKTGRIKCIGFLVMIMMFAVFCGITNNITVVHAETDGEFEYSWLNCEGTEIEINGYNGSDTEVVIPSEIEGKLVTRIGSRAFNGCSSLVNITIPASVTSIGREAFNGTPWLANKRKENSLVVINHIVIDGSTCCGEVVIPEGVTGIVAGAFEGCSELTSIKIPDSVTHVGNAVFSGCNNLKSISIGEGLTSIGEYTFDGCSSLVEISIPDSLVRIERGAFVGCSSLKSITLAKNVEYLGTGNIGDWYYPAFLECNNLEEINVSSENKVFSSKEGILYNKDMTKIICVPKALTSCVIPESVKSIEEGAFGYCNNLEEIEFSGNVVNIGRNAFMECHNLKTVKMSDSITDIGKEVFGWCSSLKQIHLSDNLKEIPVYAFIACSSLVEITIPGSDTIIEDGSFAPFVGCEALQQIHVSKEHPNYADYKGILYNKDLTEILYVPEGIEKVEIPSSITSIGNNEFWNCSSLTNIELPDSITSIGYNAFSDNVTLIVSPNSYAEIYAEEHSISYIYSGNYWTVTIKNSDGKIVKTLPVNKGGILSAPQPSEERTNETFLGFFDGDVSFDFSKPITGNVTLMEKWEAKKENLEMPETPITPETPDTPPQEGGIMLSKEALFFDTIGVTQTLTATVTPDTADKKVTWTSSDEKVATVMDGVVTSVGNGMAVITVKSSDGKTAAATVTVSQKTTKLSIQLNGQSVSGTLKAKVKKSYRFKAVVTPSNADTKNAAVTWTSSNKKIATVTST